jgi:hypothetical protein
LESPSLFMGDIGKQEPPLNRYIYFSSSLLLRLYPCCE